MENSWLPLAEYSSKYKVSVSTLRRRIKSQRAEFILEEGKYLLKDEPLQQHIPQSKKAPQNSQAQAIDLQPESKLDFVEDLACASETTESIVPVGLESKLSDSNSPILSTVNRLLNEIKSAYVLILQEKEEQILQLKEEVADLKTLARILESDNDRLKKVEEERKAQNSLVDDWLKDI